MTRSIKVMMIVLFLFSVSYGQRGRGNAPAKKNSPVVDAILKEATENSQLQKIAHELLDVIGPRLVGTPQMKQANDWAVKTYKSWGIKAENQKWGEWKGWERGITHVDMIEPRLRTLEAKMLAWSPSTSESGITASCVVLPTVEDADGCSIETIETIGNTLTFSSIYVNVSDENCSGNDGIIDIYVSPPSSSYTYSWSYGATTQDLFGVVAGTYSVTIDDGSGCIGTMDTTINDSFSFSSSYTATHEFCSDGTGSIDLSVAGGSGPFDYSWNTGDTTEDISGLSANTYVATVTNLDDGCIDSITVVINDTIGFTITDVIQSDSCGFGNGSIDLNLSGSVEPFTFTWSNGESTEDITGLTAGNYSVEIIDQGTGCTKTMDYVVLSSSSYGLVGSVADASCPTCADGAISISLTGSPTGPFEVLWSNGDTVFNIDSLLPGWYTLNVEDALGCMVVDSFEINAPTLIVENNSWNVLIYPNPTSEVFKVNYQVSGAKELNFEIFDIVGQLIKTRRSGSNEGVVRFDLNGERSGTYYLRISSSNSSKTYRLMLIR